MKLFVPSITITTLSFITFFLDPLVGERFSYGIAVILAVIMNDVVATSMMPVTSSTILMDYVSMMCLIFAILSLGETGFVLNLYHRTDKNWFHALMPVGGYKVYREFIRKIRLYKIPKHGRPSAVGEVPIPRDRKGIFRLQLYREIFFSLDKNHSGELELQEIEAFALSVLGFHEEGADARNEVLDKVDLGKNGRLNFDEFVAFCERNIEGLEDIHHLTKMLRGYVRALDRQGIAIREMWKRRALMVDTVCRIAIPLGYMVSLIYILTLDERSIEDVEGEDDRKSQWLIKTSGFWVVGACCLMYFFYVVFRCLKRTKKNNSMSPGEHGIMDSIKPVRSTKDVNGDKVPGGSDKAVAPAGQAPRLLSTNEKCPPEAGEVDRMLQEELEEQKKEADQNAKKNEAVENNPEQIPAEPTVEDNGNADDDSKNADED
jgi:hypothetical protein